VAWGIDATDAELEDCPDRRGGARGVVFRQPEGDGLAVAARDDDCAAGRAIATAAAGREELDRGGAGRDRDIGDPRTGRESRAAQFRRQGR
jgi:hypothetical protein